MYMLYHQTAYTPCDVIKEYVYKKAKVLLTQERLCCCNACCSAVTRYALCDLPVMKASCITQDVHMRFALLEQQLQADMIVAILKAIKQTGISCGNCVKAKTEEHYSQHLSAARTKYKSDTKDMKEHTMGYNFSHMS